MAWSGWVPMLIWLNGCCRSDLPHCWHLYSHGVCLWMCSGETCQVCSCKTDHIPSPNSFIHVFTACVWLSVSPPAPSSSIPLQLYSVLIAVVSLLFGVLPVGASWYPWYVAWFIMAAIMVIIFVLFSSNADSPTSRPLLKRMWVQQVPQLMCWNLLVIVVVTERSAPLFHFFAIFLLLSVTLWPTLTSKREGLI